MHLNRHRFEGGPQDSKSVENDRERRLELQRNERDETRGRSTEKVHIRSKIRWLTGGHEDFIYTFPRLSSHLIMGGGISTAW